MHHSACPSAFQYSVGQADPGIAQFASIQPSLRQRSLSLSQCCPNRWKARFSLWTSSVFLFVLFTDRSIPPNNMCTVYCTVYSYSCGRKNVFYSALPRTALSLTQCCSGQHSADLPEAINVTHVILKSTDSTTNGNISANSLNRFLSYKRKPHVTELSKHLGTL